MAIRPEFRWWILTVVVVGVLLVISALALDRPNVVWEKGKPFCPQCRSEVAPYSSRCPTCQEQYDWAVAPEGGMGLSPWSLSALESNWVHDRIAALGPDVAAARIGEALHLSSEASKAYLDHVGRGLCGWCGGTGRDLAAEVKEDVPCPVCFGRRDCIACRGDRRVRVGDEAAHRALLAYQVGVADVDTATHLPHAVRLEEVRRLTETLVLRHAGTAEMEEVWFWPRWRGTGGVPKAIQAGRGRLDTVVKALEAD